MDALPTIPILVPEPDALTPVERRGRIKAEVSDFRVEEVPAYTPEGSGDHLYLWIEKEDVSAPFLLQTVSRRLGVNRGEIGCAGQKDRRAITRQWLSVPAAVNKVPVAPEAVEGPVGDTGRITLLDQGLHKNKLRTGHLQGNRFEIRVTDRDPSDDGDFLENVERMVRTGFVNTYGAQRFGHGDNVSSGLEVLGGARIRDKRKRRFLVSALQSGLFNHWARLRHEGAGFQQALAGDLLVRLDSGGVFEVEDAEGDTKRIAAGEVAVAGPIFGNKARRATGPAAEYELQALSDFGLAQDAFAPMNKLAPGSRRQAVLLPEGLSCVRDGDALVLRFGLPAGAYATVVLAHLAGGRPAEGPRAAPQSLDSPPSQP
jgi:tRNA pseudouridine13 synthase